ncbi:PRC-barrel domain-containing protein [Maledivibacter halophilus]|uniref:Uncharacterized protein YrrD, contains PRC-barrel domain n=1 Tax=Maledivibacter halophilus TaxID=36842 RepID=A0A1T5L245_9FIRM|nr:PRC-barrel domain-containing protein [Maledivibacter halophilus]SKC69775.1 Uncharacterized protein YrrD, contains PRC-barrel domain [Maledivibacter halophilus]
MLKTSDLIGFPILCADEKNFIGEVKDAILDLDSCRLSGLIIDYGSIIHYTRVIDFNSIYGISKNEVIVKFKKNIQQIKNFKLNEKFMKKSEKIVGVEVVENEGKLLGFIKDVIFEEKSGNILGFILTNGVIDDIFNGMEILPLDGPIVFNKNKFIISRNSRKSILKNIGGLKKLLELEQ